VGVHGSGNPRLPPEELFKRWVKILRAAQRYVRQLPNDQMNLDGTHNRRRPNREVGHHIFRIGEKYLECVVNGAKALDGRKLLKDGTFTTGEEITRYGDEVITRLEQWWNGLADHSCQQRIEVTDYGVISTHQLLERCTWHSAHHTRQIADVLERQGIEPDGRFTKEDLAGLPLPERIWD
jgi:hypothetical protein